MSDKFSASFIMAIILIVPLFFIGCGASPRIHHSGVGESSYFPAQVFPVPQTMDFEIKDRIEAEAHRKSILGIRISGENKDAPKVTAMGQGMTYYLERKAVWNALEEGGYDGIYVIRTHVDRGGILPPLYRIEEARVYGYGIRILSFDRIDDAERQDRLMTRELTREEIEKRGILSTLLTPFRYLLAPMFPFMII